MAKPTLYLESSIISYLASRPNREMIIGAMQQWTHAWWNRERGKFAIFISEFVMLEIRRGDPSAVREREKFTAGVPSVVATKSMRRFARRLIRELRIPKKSRIDASHLAIAIEAQMNYLLTWNCRHIDNPMHANRLRELAERRGLRMPIICTPYDLLKGAINES